jgi:hypothetical protein
MEWRLRSFCVRVVGRDVGYRAARDDTAERWPMPLLPE